MVGLCLKLSGSEDFLPSDAENAVEVISNVLPRKWGDRIQWRIKTFKIDKCWKHWNIVADDYVNELVQNKRAVVSLKIVGG